MFYVIYENMSGNLTIKKVSRNNGNMFLHTLSSIIQYGITSWGGDYLNNIKPLINTQSRLIRLFNCDLEDLENQILTIKELYAYNILVYLFKNRTFCSVRDTVKYNLRTKYIYNIPKANKKYSIKVLFI